MDTNPPVTLQNLLQHLNKFNSQICSIYNNQLEFLTRGMFFIESDDLYEASGNLLESSVVFQNNNSNHYVIIKNLHNEIISDSYIIHIMSPGVNNFLKLTVNEAYFDSTGSKTLTSRESIPQDNCNQYFLMENVTKLQYDQFINQSLNFDWENIIVPSTCTGTEKEDAFEDLVQALLQRLNVKNYDRIGKGADRGRDASFEMDLAEWLPRSTSPIKWIVQCKYSKTSANLLKDEIFKEMVTVIMHNPDFYLLVTNRKLTQDFIDWFKTIQNIRNDYIPYKRLLLQKEDLEAILSLGEYTSIREKYFK
ncbi:hypothetical protein PTI45_03944 [Paenibacillus nuruki]|uniref:Restriction endonuclease type IV Mrr domain-containing protein n=1 Tax=Paenibacillus nuruki TaxID=1886670 RepID=A0A1E3KZ59_9BACL|nr:restriction endonuclease [Paenibacillus nuruki]ODP26693.1 hypothetical protein PTI45_03944 [Paenibacillus nuruki]